jgi:hypothetical protein
VVFITTSSPSRQIESLLPQAGKYVQDAKISLLYIFGKYKNRKEYCQFSEFPLKLTLKIV